MVTDNVQSSKGLYTLLRETMYLPANFRFLDGCWLSVFFDRRLDADFCRRRFPKGATLYVNGPYRKIDAFVAKCFILFYKYRINVIAVLPTAKFDHSAFVTNYVRPCVREVPLTLFPFLGYPRNSVLRTSVSAYYFLRPELLDVIACRHGEAGKEWGAKAVSELMTVQGEDLTERLRVAGKLRYLQYPPAEVLRRLGLDKEHAAAAEAESSKFADVQRALKTGAADCLSNPGTRNNKPVTGAVAASIAPASVNFDCTARGKAKPPLARGNAPLVLVNPSGKLRG